MHLENGIRQTQFSIKGEHDFLRALSNGDIADVLEWP